MIKLKIAVCKECTDGKEKPVVKGLCRYHYWKSKAKKPLKAKPKKTNSGQMDLFDTVWEQRKHVCFITGMSLHDKEYYKANNNYHWLFHHVLNKGKYTKFKLYAPNIVILHPMVHFDVENLEESVLLAKYPGYHKLLILRQELLDEYNNL